MRAHRQLSGDAGATPSTFDCTAYGSQWNTKLDCDTPLPNNEVQIAVDPTDADHMIASSNDYDSCCDGYYTTFDAGATWSTGNMSHESNLGPGFGSDPVTSFDTKHGTAIHASVNLHLSPSGAFFCDIDIVASISTDGGINWDQDRDPVVVYPGVGCENSRYMVFNDKEWITTDNQPSSPYYGRTYMTWSKFGFKNGVYIESPIWEAHSDDGGYTWSTAQEISGSDPTCTYQPHGRPLECDEDQFSVPTVGADGTVYVSFSNEQNESIWEPLEAFDDQILVIKSTNGGVSWSDPVMAAALEDGSRDYPFNVYGRQTLTGYQLRLGQNTSSVVSTYDGKLYVVWSDNRNGKHDANNPVTSSDVFMAYSSDGGTTWTAPITVSDAPSDQWQAWMDVNPTNGNISVVYLDRSWSSRTRFYNVTLAAAGPGGVIGFTHARASIHNSDPVRSLFVQAGIPSCLRCATFNGDYIGVAFGSDGSRNIVWTDMSTAFSRTKHLEFAFFARM